MEIYVEDVRIGGRKAIERLLSFDGEARRGLRAAAGLNFVAGLTGAGKSALGLALWWFLAYALSRHESLFGCDGVWDAVVEIAGRAGLPRVDGYVEVCLEEHELPARYSGRYCVSWDGSAVQDGGVPELTKAVLGSIVAWPAQVREVVPLAGPRRCGALVHLVPPVSVDGSPLIDVEVRSWLQAGRYSIDGAQILAYSQSSGERDEAVLRAAVELADVFGRGAPPLIYIDGLEHIHTDRLIELAKLARNAGGAIYVASHRLEISDIATRYYVASYGLGLSRVLNVPRSFRLALVEVGKVPPEYEAELEEASKALTGLDHEELRRTLSEALSRARAVKYSGIF